MLLSQIIRDGQAKATTTMILDLFRNEYLYAFLFTIT